MGYALRQAPIAGSEVFVLGVNNGKHSPLYLGVFNGDMDFRQSVATGEDTEIDAYAAETPGEFFAVLSEAFFETPLAVLRAYLEAYAQLKLFYRQDPVQRIPS